MRTKIKKQKTQLTTVILMYLYSALTQLSQGTLHHRTQQISLQQEAATTATTVQQRTGKIPLLKPLIFQAL